MERGGHAFRLRRGADAPGERGRGDARRRGRGVGVIVNNVIDAFPNQIADRLAAGLERRGPGLGRGADGGLVRPLDGEDDLRVFVVVGFEVEVEGDFFFDACLFFSLCSLSDPSLSLSLSLSLFLSLELSLIFISKALTSLRARP